ncbi:hypothetical protein CDAR_286101 [Caerostris darwini]|uniref:Uncharacterized protein n=1 Tax=Caerostris darwini TaxID=1538125 RepID=A0AAV4N4E8_9ARAC|nr:hypothetical protein CDAR_286101 [Caerostris darwini]
MRGRRDFFARDTSAFLSCRSGILFTADRMSICDMIARDDCLPVVMTMLYDKANPTHGRMKPVPERKKKANSPDTRKEEESRPSLDRSPEANWG